MLLLFTVIILFHHKPLAHYCRVVHVVQLLEISVVKEMVSRGKLVAKFSTTWNGRQEAMTIVRMEITVEIILGSEGLSY